MSIRPGNRQISGFFAALALAVAGDAQTMNFSFYNNGSVSSDYSTVSAYFNVIDSSTCGHSAYSTTVTITSPDSRYASSGGSGLTGSASIPVENVMGSYAPNAAVVYYCPCIPGYAGAGGGGTPIPVSGYTPIQHNYPRNPLPSACRVASFFDAIRNNLAHHAQDLVYDNGSGGQTIPPIGTPVYAMEDGTVAAAKWTAGPSSAGFPGCVGQNVPGNYLQVSSNPPDGYTPSTFTCCLYPHFGRRVHQYMRGI